MNSGSVLTLNPPARCGLSLNAFQTRPTVDLLSPDLLAIDARDQWVASFGVSSSVSTTMASTCSSVTDTGRPGRSSSPRPSSRRSMNRARHLPTVAGVTPSLAATCLLSVPSAHASTILARSARDCADLARRARRCSVARSCSVSTSSAFGRPVFAMPATLPGLAAARSHDPAGHAKVLTYLC